MSQLNSQEFQQINDLQQNKLKRQLHQRLKFVNRTVTYTAITITLFSLAILTSLTTYLTNNANITTPFLLILDVACMTYVTYRYSRFKRKLKYFNANSMPYPFRVMKLLEHHQLEIISSQSLVLPNLKVNKPPFYLKQYFLQDKIAGNRFTLTLP